MKAELGTLEELKALAADCQYSSSRMAEELGLSERQFRRRFHQLHKCSPGKWLRWLRMLRAVELQQSRMRPKDVAFELGYAHASNLLRARKRSIAMQAMLITQLS